MRSMGSHRTERRGDKVVIRDLELFVGYDPSIDDADNEKVRKYDEERVEAVAARTREYMSRGQHPQICIGHNKPGSNNPVVGTVTDIRTGRLGRGHAIFGDVVMSAEQFAEHIESNKMPRRSAEIWKDGFLSEVALLGSQTPARPLPDTHFAKAREGVECFSRETDDGDFTMTDSLQSERDEFKRERDLFERERDQFKRERDEAIEERDALRIDLRKEKYAREMDSLARSGVRVPRDKEVYAKVLERIAGADDPDGEMAFFKSQWAADPIGKKVDQTGAVLDDGDGGGTGSAEDDDAIKKRVVKRMTSEKLGADQYSRVWDEEEKKHKKGAAAA